MNGTLYMTEFAEGWLFAEAQKIARHIQVLGEEDWWEGFNDVPQSLPPHCVYENYDLNFWRDDMSGKWHCSAYAVMRKEDGTTYTNTDEHRRLW